MPAFVPPDWYLRLVRALEAADPEQARTAAHGLLGEIRDAEARLRERLEMLSSASFEGIFVHVDGVVLDANQRMCELLGCELVDVLGPDTMARSVAPEDLPSVLERVASHYEGAYVITAVRNARSSNDFLAVAPVKERYDD